MSDTESSIFQRYYTDSPFVDRFEKEPANAVDVVIPIIHANELWKANLLSIYREIPVKRLILGDGGCVDGSVDLAKKFPRVEVLDHRAFTSLGFSIRHLIEAVNTEWFVYLHSDVFLPPGWFEAMCAHRAKFDWFECDQRITILADYALEVAPGTTRAFSGSQMGRKASFQKVTPQIDDDYLYRTEDIVIADLVARAGHRYGRATDTFHFHQVMHKPSRWGRKVKGVSVALDLAPDEDLRATNTYVRAIIKYLQPDLAPHDVVQSLHYQVSRLIGLGTTMQEIRDWTRATNAAWLPYLVDGSPRRNYIARQVTVAAEFYRVHGMLRLAGYAVEVAVRRLGRLLSRGR